MNWDLNDPAEVAGGSWWKPAEHDGSVHVIFGVEAARRMDDPNDRFLDAANRQDRTARCRLVIVLDEYTGEEVSVYERQTIRQQVLVKSLLATCEGPQAIFAGRLVKPNRAWLWTKLDDGQKARTGEWLEANAGVDGDGCWILTRPEADRTANMEAPF